MHNQTWKEFIWAPDLTWLIIFLKLVTLAIMILKSGSSTDRGRSNCTASFISRISSAFCPDEIRESWKQKHTNKDVIFQIFQRGIKVRNTQNTKEPRSILGKELVCVSGHHLFFLSVFNIVGDELDKLGAESLEGGVPMDHQLFLDPVTVFTIYRGYTAKGISTGVYTCQTWCLIQKSICSAFKMPTRQVLLCISFCQSLVHLMENYMSKTFYYTSLRAYPK